MLIHTDGKLIRNFHEQKLETSIAVSSRFGTKSSVRLTKRLLLCLKVQLVQPY